MSTPTTPGGQRPPPPPPPPPPVVAPAPKRGGIHPVYGLYIAGSGLDQDYKPKERNTYSYASQRRNVMTISSIERDLVTARDAMNNLKFDGRLEPVVTSTTEVGKEKFLTLL